MINVVTLDLLEILRDRLRQIPACLNVDIMEIPNCDDADQEGLPYILNARYKDTIYQHGEGDTVLNCINHFCVEQDLQHCIIFETPFHGDNGDQTKNEDVESILIQLMARTNRCAESDCRGTVDSDEEYCEQHDHIYEQE